MILHYATINNVFIVYRYTNIIRVGVCCIKTNPRLHSHCPWWIYRFWVSFQIVNPHPFKLSSPWLNMSYHVLFTNNNKSKKCIIKKIKTFEKFEISAKCLKMIKHKSRITRCFYLPDRFICELTDIGAHLSPHYTNTRAAPAICAVFNCESIIFI